LSFGLFINIFNLKTYNKKFNTQKQYTYEIITHKYIQGNGFSLFGQERDELEDT
jgi:hypothetical protein